MTSSDDSRATPHVVKRSEKNHAASELIVEPRSSTLTRVEIQPFLLRLVSTRSPSSIF
jgi:hypothetical protein